MSDLISGFPWLFHRLRIGVDITYEELVISRADWVMRQLEEVRP